MFSKKFFSQRLKQLRINNKLTTVDLSKEIGISKQSISQFEQEAIYPHCNTLIALADYFDVSLDYLTGRSDDPRRH